MTAIGGVLTLLLIYFVKEATSKFSFANELVECSICHLSSSANGEGRISPLKEKKDFVDSKLLLQKNSRDAEANTMKELECSICEANSNESILTQDVLTSSETVVNSSTSCDFADLEVFLPETQCPSEMKWIHQLEVITKSITVSA